MKQIYLPSVGSTNAWMQENLMHQTWDEGTLVYADYQTNGRGQLTNTWESEAGKNILMSMYFAPLWLPIKDQFVLSQAVALGVVDFLRQYADGFQIKWPNDIYWQHQKIAGILIEQNLVGGSIASSIVGIGLNINQNVFLSDAPNPVSLYQIIGKELPLQEVLQQLQKSLVKRYQQAKSQPTNIQADYASVLYLNGKWAYYKDDNGEFEGRILYVEPRGYLHIEDKEQVVRKYAFKEVQFLLDKNLQDSH